MKICLKCGERKPESEYHRKARNSDGLDTRCKTCVCEAVRNAAAEKKAKQLINRRYYHNRKMKKIRAEMDQMDHTRSCELLKRRIDDDVPSG